MNVTHFAATDTLVSNLNINEREFYDDTLAIPREVYDKLSIEVPA
ncbi:hypothetical protein [Enterovibrio norvegicus]|nr:hypothetical protein [Enterovibrio norvegicus]